MAIYPTVAVIIGSLRPGAIGSDKPLGLVNYAHVFSQAETYSVLLNTVVFGVGSTVISLAFGLPLAWLVSRTDMPLRGLLQVTAVIPFMVPGLVLTMGWIFLLSPTIGVLNIIGRDILGLPSFNIYSVPGMIWVWGLDGAPLIFLIVSSALRSMDPSLEEAARMSGGKTRQVAFGITLPLMRPAILAAFLLAFIRSIEIFDTPALLGLPAQTYVMTTLIYREVAITLPQNHGLAATYGIILLLIAFLLVYVYRRMTARAERFAVIGGKGHRPSIIHLGKWKYLGLTFSWVYMVLAAILPLIILALVAFQHSYSIPTLDTFRSLTTKHFEELLGNARAVRSIYNSVILAVGAATAGVLLTTVISYVTVRTKLPGRGTLEAISFIPFGLPAIVVGVGLLWAYISFPIGVYGTLWILLIAYITRFLPFGLRSVGSNMIQVHKDLEEASRVSGGSWMKTFRHILLPLIRPGMVAAWIFLTIVSIRELGASILLFSFGSEVMPVVLFNWIDDGFLERATAIGLIMVAITIVLSIVAFKVAKLRVGEAW